MIEAQDIIKQYHGFRALDEVSVHIKKGEFYGLLGPNGAGKTTLINILSGLLPFDSGKVRIAGQTIPPGKKELKSLIGVVPQEIALYEELTALDNLLFWGKFYALSRDELRTRCDMLLELTGLKDKAGQRIVTYSGGMKRRINMACALIHQPPVLIMDEPTVGIDPQSRNLIYSILEDYRNQGITILYTSHYLDEFEKLCDKTGIIDNGRIIAEGSIPELKDKYAQDEIIIIEFEHEHALNLPELIAEKLPVRLKYEGNKLYVHCRNASLLLPELTRMIYKTGKQIRHLDVIHTGLESIFFNLTGTSLRDE